MKQGIHPNYVDCTITCCVHNNVIQTTSTNLEIHIEVCSCHPFYTGKQKLVDTGGRVAALKEQALWPRRQSVA